MALCGTWQSELNCVWFLVLVLLENTTQQRWRGGMAHSPTPEHLHKLSRLDSLTSLSPPASLRKGRDCLKLLLPNLRSPARRSPHLPFPLIWVEWCPSHHQGQAPPAGLCTPFHPAFSGPLHLTIILDHSLLSTSPSPGFFRLTLERIHNSLHTKKWRTFFPLYY